MRWVESERYGPTPTIIGKWLTMSEFKIFKVLVKSAKDWTTLQDGQHVSFGDILLKPDKEGTVVATASLYPHWIPLLPAHSNYISDCVSHGVVM